MNPRKPAGTHKLDARIAELWPDHNISEIAETLNVHEIAVRRRALAMDLWNLWPQRGAHLPDRAER